MLTLAPPSERCGNSCQLESRSARHNIKMTRMITGSAVLSKEPAKVYSRMNSEEFRKC